MRRIFRLKAPSSMAARLAVYGTGALTALFLLFLAFTLTSLPLKIVQLYLLASGFEARDFDGSIAEERLHIGHVRDETFQRVFEMNDVDLELNLTDRDSFHVKHLTVGDLTIEQRWRKKLDTAQAERDVRDFVTKLRALDPFLKPDSRFNSFAIDKIEIRNIRYLTSKFSEPIHVDHLLLHDLRGTSSGNTLRELAISGEGIHLRAEKLSVDKPTRVDLELALPTSLFANGGVILNYKLDD